MKKASKYFNKLLSVLVFGIGVLSSQIVYSQCSCDFTLSGNVNNVTLASGTTCISTGTNLQNAIISGPASGTATLCIADGQTFNNVSQVLGNVIINNSGTLSIKTLNAPSGTTNRVNVLGSGSLSINEVKSSGTSVINGDVSISLFSGNGNLDLFGVTTISSMFGANGQTINNNLGARTVISQYNANGETQFNNFEGARLSFFPNSIDLNSSNIFNEDTITFTALNTGSGSEIVNNGWVYITDGQFNPQGSIVNNGWIRSSGFMNVGGGPITNNCWLITDDAFNYNSSLDFINNGGIWVESSGKSWQLNTGTFKLGEESIIYSRGSFSNGASIILLDPNLPGAKFYVAGESKNQGVFGAEGTPVDVINFYDEGGSGFDSGNDAVGSGVTFDPIAEPDTISFSSTCNARITSDEPPVLDLDEDDVTVTGKNYQGSFTEGGTRSPIGETVNVTDESGNITSATVTLTNSFDGSDESLLLATGLVSANITYDVVSLTEITFTGLASVEEYEDAIGAITYVNNSENPTETDRVITVTVTNGINKTASANAILTIIGVNNDPEGVNDALTVNEGGTQDELTIESGALSVLANDSDVENDDLTATIETSDVKVSHGTLTLNPDGTFEYIHDGSETTSDLFTYTLNDENGGTATVTVNITIVPVNDLPVGIDDALEVDEGGTQTVLTVQSGATSVLANDTDAENSTLNATVVTNVSHGTLTLNPNGTFIYEHDGTETTTDEFTYRVNDGTDNGNVVTVRITINPLNDAPLGIDDALEVNEGGTQTVLTVQAGATSVLANDTDAENSILIAELVTGVSNGILTFSPDGTFIYEHDGSETTTDEFTYLVKDGTTDGNVVTVRITIFPVNDIPVALPDTIIVNEGGTQTILKSGEVSVLVNDTDGDLGTDLDAVKITDPIHTLNGVFTFNEADGTFSYTHDGSETTSDSFDYRVTDGITNGNTVTVVVIIVPVNDNPVAVDDVNKIKEGDGSVTHASPDSEGPLLVNDSDIDGDDIEVSSVTPLVGTYGTITFSSDGTYTYTLNLVTTEPLKEGEVVEDVFSYTISDGNGGTASANLTIEITGINDTPDLVDDENALSEGDDPITHTDGNGPLLQNDNDIDGDGLTVSSIEGDNTGSVTGTYGTLTWGTDGTYTYTLNNDAVDSLQVGEVVTDTYTYTATDGIDSETADLVITITGVNDDPIARDDENGMSEATDEITEADGSGPLLQNDTDIDGDNLTVNTVGGSSLSTVIGTFGTLTWDADGTYTYDLDNTNPTVAGLGDAETLVETFAYTITDGNGGSAGADLIITITGGNSNPSANPDVNSINEDDVSISSSALADGTGAMVNNDTDVDVSDDLDVDRVNGSASLTTLGSFGTLVWVAEDGAYTYTLDNSIAAVQALAVGETLEDVFTYRVVDGNGGTSPSTLTITINGINDEPVAIANTNSMTEGDGSITDVNSSDSPNGNLLSNDTDIDVTDNLEVSEIGGETSDPVVGTYGTLTWLPNGSYTYVENDLTTEPLKQGEVVTDVFQYTISDGNGGTDNSTLTITITGVNDVPVGVNDSIVVFESGDTTLLETGLSSVLDNDLDNEGDVLNIKLGTNVTNGTLDLNLTDGTFIYTHNGTETTTDFFTYIVNDGSVDGNEVTVTIRIIPINDQPIAINDTNRITEGVISVVESDGSGNILANDDDVDVNTTLTVATIENSINDTIQGTYGILVWAENGTYTYVLNQSSVDTLTGGEEVTDVFNYTNSDGSGLPNGSADAILTIFITGVNDGPVAVDDVNEICEGDLPISTVDSTLLVANDLDADFETLTVIEVEGSTNTTIDGIYGTLEWLADGSYTYELNNDAVDSLQLNQIVLETFGYVVTDGTVSDDATLIITITGKNDNPIARKDSNALTEVTDRVASDGPLSTGTLLSNDTDVDSLDVIFVGSIQGLTIDSIPGLYGVLTWSPADGSYLYDLDNSLDTVKGLAINETLLDTFLYVINDGNGGLDSTLLCITIIGTNEDPRSIDDVNNIYEDTVSVSGNILTNDTDGDDSDTIVVTAINGQNSSSVDGLYGTIVWGEDGTYTYFLNNEDTANVQSLAVGESIIETFTYDVTDGNGGPDNAILEITINGVNDIPVAVNDFNFINEEVDFITVSNPDSLRALLFNDSDIDATDILVVVSVNNSPGATVKGDYGTIEWNADGTYVYDLENSHPDVASLAQGEELVDTFSYQITDGHSGNAEALLIITISGGNQIPEALNDTICVQEGNPLVTSPKTLLLNDIDEDASDVLYVTELGGDVSGTLATLYGEVKWDTAGVYSFEVDNDLGVVQQLGPQDSLVESYEYFISDGKVDTISATLFIIVKGINDESSIIPDDLSVTEDDGPTDSSEPLLANDTDTDVTDTLKVIVVSSKSDTATVGDTIVVGEFGTLIWDEEGNYTYVLNNLLDTVQALNVGDQIEDVFEYVTTDGNTSNLSSTLTVTINGINDDPIIVDTLGGTAIDIIFITLDELTSKDTLLSADDIDDLQSVLTWEIIEEDPANPETGTAELDEESGVLTYTTEFNFFENTGDTLTARVCDDGLGCDTVLVIVSIIDVNDPPVALNDTMCTSYFASVEIDVLANDTDPDGKIDLDSTSVTIESYPENGDLDIDPVTGVVTFSPYEGFWGDDEFQYIVYDKFGVASNVATVKLCVGERPPLVPSEGITPNNDGKNDSWWIENIQFYTSAEVEVYNRWGNLVWQQSCCYDNNDPEKRWNGESNIGAGSGGQVPDGSYYFVIRSSDGDIESFTGYIVKN